MEVRFIRNLLNEDRPNDLFVVAMSAKKMSKFGKQVYSMDENKWFDLTNCKNLCTQTFRNKTDEIVLYSNITG